MCTKFLMCLQKLGWGMHHYRGNNHMGSLEKTVFYFHEVFMTRGMPRYCDTYNNSDNFCQAIFNIQFI